MLFNPGLFAFFPALPSSRLLRNLSKLNFISTPFLLFIRISYQFILTFVFIIFFIYKTPSKVALQGRTKAFLKTFIQYKFLISFTKVKFTPISGSKVMKFKRILYTFSVKRASKVYKHGRNLFINLHSPTASGCFEFLL